MFVPEGGPDWPLGVTQATPTRSFWTPEDPFGNGDARTAVCTFPFRSVAWRPALQAKSAPHLDLGIIELG